MCLCQELLDAARPYRVKGEEKMELNVRKPKLCTIDLEEDYKANLFLSCLVGDVMVPLISQGDKGLQRVMMTMDGLHKALEMHLDDDLPDAYVSSIADINVFCRAMLGLGESQPFMMLKYVSNVDKVKSYFRVVGDSPLHLLANAVCESPFWETKVKHFQELTLTFATHAPRIDKVKDFLNEFSLDKEKRADQLETFLAVIKEVQYLKEELKHESIAKMTSEFADLLESFWQSIQEDLEKQADVELNESQFQDLIMEASITYGDMASLESIKQARAAHLIERSGMTKLSALLQELSEFLQQIEVEKQEVIIKGDKVVGKARDAAGISIPDAKIGEVQKQFKTSILLVEQLAKSHFGQAMEIFKVLQALQPWMPTDMAGSVFARLSAGLLLRQALLKAETKITEVKADVKFDGDTSKMPWLAELMRCVAHQQSFKQEPAEQVWGQDFIPEWLTSAEAAVLEMEKLIVEFCRKMALQVAKAAEPLAGGMDDGRLWTSLIQQPETCEWSAVVKAAKQSLGKAPPEKLESTISDLEEVSFQQTRN